VLSRLFGQKIADDPFLELTGAWQPQVKAS
jgi:hypothetical protein